MILSGLSQGLVAALTQTAAALPDLLYDIQVQLMDCLSLVLSKKPFCSSCSKDKALTLMAANAQGGFDYWIHSVLTHVCGDA